MLRSCDEAIVSVANTLRKQKRLRSALFIVVSDNGYMLGEHRLETKGTPYDASLRVAMRAMGPGIASRQTSDRLVAVQDVATTIARVAGVRYARTDGRDFRPGKSPDHEHVLIQYYGSGESWIGLRGKDFLYVERPTGELEYYDRTTDPDELNNLLADWEGHEWQLDGAQRLQLFTKLRAAVGCKGATCP
jgi:arylsulfatase A-like enzyme